MCLFFFNSSRRENPPCSYLSTVVPQAVQVKLIVLRTNSLPRWPCQAHWGHDVVHWMHLYTKEPERTQNLRSDFLMTSKWQITSCDCYTVPSHPSTPIMCLNEVITEYNDLQHLLWWCSLVEYFSWSCLLRAPTEKSWRRGLTAASIQVCCTTLIVPAVTFTSASLAQLFGCFFVFFVFFKIPVSAVSAHSPSWEI